MKVYIVKHYVAHEGFTIMFVSLTKQNAHDYLEQNPIHQIDEWYEIDEWEVDEAP